MQVFQKGSLPVSDSHLVRFSAPVNAYLSFDSRSKVFQTSFLFCSLRESQWVLFYSLKNSRERKILDSKNYRYMYIFKSSMSFVIFHCNYSKKNRKNSPKESSSSNYLTRPIYETLKLRKTRKFGFSYLFSFGP